MPDHKLDYENFAKTIGGKIYKLSDVKHKLEKVCFDIVKFKDEDQDDLWQVMNAEDGSYIVARYSSSDDDAVKEAKASTTEKWDVLVSQAGYLHFYYNGQPMGTLSADKLGIPAADLPAIKRFLPAKLASDQSFVKTLRDELDKSNEIAE